MYLYEAIRQVLEENGNVPMRIEDIANAINQRGAFCHRCSESRMESRRRCYERHSPSI